jgi:hypothetical protein
VSWELATTTLLHSAKLLSVAKEKNIYPMGSNWLFSRIFLYIRFRCTALNYQHEILFLKEAVVSSCLLLCKYLQSKALTVKQWDLSSRPVSSRLLLCIELFSSQLSTKSTNNTQVVFLISKLHIYHLCSIWFDDDDLLCMLTAYRLPMVFLRRSRTFSVETGD